MSDSGKISPTHDHRAMTGGEWGQLLLLSLIWSTSFFLMKIADRGLPPFTLVFLRIASAAIILHIFVRLKKLSFPHGLDLWKQFALLGFINNVIPMSLIFWAETIIPSGIAGVLNAAVPLFTVLIAHFYLRQPATAAKLAGTALGMGGVAVLIGWQPVMASGAVIAELAVVLATFFYAASSLYGRRFNHLSPYVAACGQLSASTVMLAVLSLLFDHPWRLPAPGWEPLAAVLALGVFCTAFAYIMYFSILQAAGSLNITLVTFLMPVGALVLGVVFLDESLHVSVLAGLALIACGLVAIDGRILKLFGKIRPALT